VRERAIVRCPLGPILLSNLEMRFCFRGEGYNTHVSNLQDYVNHMFKRPYEFDGFQN
jgi:hypothetical protein